MAIQSSYVTGNYAGSEWGLDQGTGNRSADLYVRFNPEFANPPRIHIALSHVNAPADKPLIINVRAKDVTKVGFNLEFSTSGESIINNAIASWIAFLE